MVHVETTIAPNDLSTPTITIASQPPTVLLSLGMMTSVPRPMVRIPSTVTSTENAHHDQRLIVSTPSTVISTGNAHHY